jgi:hypothetical protein
MPDPKHEQTHRRAIGDQRRERGHSTALAEADIAEDLKRIEAELDDCQRLSEQDFAVRINARD